MKKVFLIIAVICICSSVFAQKTEIEKQDDTNEIKLNLLMTVFSFPEISYERVWGNNIGAGLSVGIPLESRNTDTKYTFMPYGRFYFGESTIKSFFIEGNMAFVGYKKYEYNYSTDYLTFSTKNSAEVGLGVAVGYKYINSKGLIGELFLGVGRTFGDYNWYYPRIGICIGKQF